MAKKKDAGFAPFENEEDSRMIGGLTIENRVDRVSIYGSLDVTLDGEGERKLQELEALVASLRAAFGRHPDLPEALPDPVLGSMENPAPSGKL